MRRLPRLPLLLLLAAVAAATAPATARPQVSLYARAGLLAPGATFYQQAGVAPGEGTGTAWSTASLGRGPLLGVGAELAWADVRLRAELGRSLDGWLRLQQSWWTPAQDGSLEAAGAGYDVPYHMTLTSLQVVLPTRLRLWGAQPYVAAGVGGRDYGFGTPTAANTTGAILPEPGFTWGGDVGAGVEVRLRGPWSLDLQGRDAVSRYWGRLQHDWVYGAALRWRAR